ncbi:MAG: lytic transglycosylase domain-containing protein [Sphingomonadaceae bacterium]|nr:lytic transglycosylase domain-containing protein [Sphingomonadaceae bacterium]
MRRVRLAAVALGAVLVAGAAHAEVISIGDDGSVTSSNGPALYYSADLKPQPIMDPAPAAQPAAATPVAVAVPPGDIAAAIGASSARHGLDPALVAAVAWRESRMNMAALSPRGAIGVMQLMPGTARMLAVDPTDPNANIEGGVTYLSQLMRHYGGDIIKTLAAYNAGPGAVDRYGGIPPYRETVAYVGAILDRLSAQALRPQ